MESQREHELGWGGGSENLVGVGEDNVFLKGLIKKTWYLS